MLGRDLWLVPIFCARLNAEGVEIAGEDRELLLHFTAVSSWLVEQSCKDKQFTRAEGAPGYLFTELNGRRYFVPYGLVSVFPNRQQLVSLDKLVSLVRLEPTSALCLSGSSTFIGQISCVGDIDFCEYFFEKAPALAESVVKKIPVQLECQLLQIKDTQNVYHPPFSGVGSAIGKASMASEVIPEPIKVDFLVKFDPLGTIVATNLILPVDAAYSQGDVLERSFQHQEAVILEGQHQLPGRPLIEPGDIGKYLNWLRSQVKHYVEEAKRNTSSDRSMTYGALAIKALKRALSWHLLVGLNDRVENIISILKRPEMGEIANSMRSHEVHRLLGRVDKNFEESIRKRFDVESSGSLLLVRPLQDFFENALSLAEDLLLDIDELMGSNSSLEIAA